MRRLSQTQISTFQACPQRWKLRYVDGRKEPPSPPLTFGSAIHSGLETFYRNRTAGPSPLEDVLASFDAELDPAAYDSTQDFVRATADGHAMLGSWYGKHAPDFKPALAVELALQYEIDAVPMISILDRVDLGEDGRLRITDYKTGKFFLRDKAQESQQLTLYQIAAEEKLEREVESLFLVHVPSDTEWRVARRSPAEVESVRRLVVDTAQAIEKQAFEPRTGRQCEWCHVKPWCPAFADQHPANWPEQLDPLVRTPAEVGELADALGQALQAKKDAEDRIRAVQEQLIPWFEATGQRAVAGSSFRVQASRTEKTALTCSDDELRALLEPAGLWEEILAPAYHLKTSLLQRPELPLDVRGALNERSEARVSWRLTPHSLETGGEGEMT
jgi:putative RecB family exonuclease